MFLISRFFEISWNLKISKNILYHCSKNNWTSFDDERSIHRGMKTDMQGLHNVQYFFRLCQPGNKLKDTEKLLKQNSCKTLNQCFDNEQTLENWWCIDLNHPRTKLEITSVTKISIPSAVVIHYCAWYIFVTDVYLSAIHSVQ